MPGEEVYILRATPTDFRPSPNPRVRSWIGAQNEMFLFAQLLCAAVRLRERFVFVGIETLPRPMLAHWGFDDTGLGATERAGALRTHFYETIKELARERRGSAGLRTFVGYRQSRSWGNLAVEEYVDILTHDEYRERVGDAEYDLHTFAGVDLAAEQPNA